MYSSTTNNNNNVNPFLSSSFHHHHHLHHTSPPPPFPPSSFIFHHHHDPLPNYSSHCLPNPPIANTEINHHNKSPIKTDRHSKIRTAQGLRDRRVRLSIGIARKFFDLQDTLGFDKASKTLEWLLTKSKKDIMELTTMTSPTPEKCLLSSSTTSEFEDVGSETDEAAAAAAAVNDACKIEVQKMKEKSLRKSTIIHNNLVKESREKARERARARTRGKLCNLNQIRASSSSELGICEKSRKEEEEENDYMDEENDIVAIKRKLKQPSPPPPPPPQQQQQQQQQQLSSFGHYNQKTHLVTSSTKDVPSSITNTNNNNNCYFPSLPQHWDNGAAFTRSSFYTMINTNLSTELQIYGGKPYWEAYNNQNNLH